jgi:phosphohistidine swiveling domain-containing protein
MSQLETATAPKPTPIPTPPSFPIEWSRPDDAAMFWTTDPLHFPEPVHSLEFAFLARHFRGGFNSAAAAYEMPIRAESRRFNSYFYQSIYPLMLAPEQMEAMGRRSQELMGAAMAGLAERWRAEQQPEIERYIAHWRSFDLRGASMAQLLTHFDQTVERSTRIWEIHFEVVLPMLLAMSMFSDLYRDLFGDASALDAYRLLQGFDNKSLETDRALWRLSRRAGELPRVREILASCAAHEAIAALEQHEEGRAFLAELRAFLDEYGRRADKFAMIGVPSWIEDPSPVIRNLRDYISQPDRDLAAEMARLAATREQLLAEARQRLQGYPQPVVGQFEFFLKAAQEATVLQEDHNFWIDQRSMYEVRRVALELGARLAAAGALEAAEDAIYLDIDELRASAALPTIDRRKLVAARKAEMEHFRTIAPPPALGTLPPGAPPDNPVNRAITRFFGGPPQPAAEPGLLRGNAGSPGKVRGVAKIVRSLAEAGKLNRDDILVAETTAPPWTPLFASVAAVVTDTGGILSHCAVVAREYGIPAVVGIGMATSAIHDGQVIEVDGDAGVVRIIGDEV